VTAIGSIDINRPVGVVDASVTGIAYDDRRRVARTIRVLGVLPELASAVAALFAGYTNRLVRALSILRDHGLSLRVGRGSTTGDRLPGPHRANHPSVGRSPRVYRRVRRRLVSDLLLIRKVGRWVSARRLEPSWCTAGFGVIAADVVAAVFGAREN
jgi:hypothetical protein